MDVNSDLSLTGYGIGDLFGFSVSWANDLAADGNPDVIVGAPKNDSATGSRANTGCIYVYDGGSSMDNIPDWHRYGGSAGDHFGWSVCGAGDIDSKGNSQLVVGAPYNDTGGDDVGEVEVLMIPEFPPLLLVVILLRPLFLMICASKKRRKKQDEN